VSRIGSRDPIALSNSDARKWAGIWANAFGVGPDKSVEFKKELAKDDLKEKEGANKKGRKAKGKAEEVAS